MNTLEHWERYFNLLGITTKRSDTNDSVFVLTGIAGLPLFRAVDTRSDLDDLHTKARAKSESLGRLLILGLPFDNAATLCLLPGDIALPRVRVYAGHTSSTFALTGHRIENSFSNAVKREVSLVIKEGTKTKTPLCDWLIKLVGSSWVYGKPSSKEQLDGLINLAAKDPGLIGHVRSRQLSFGRGCDSGLLLPADDVTLPNNSVNHRINQADFRFVSLENEVAKTSSARHRAYALHSHLFLKVLAEVSPKLAQELGCSSCLGGSVLGEFPTTATTPEMTKAASKKLKATIKATTV